MCQSSSAKIVVHYNIPNVPSFCKVGFPNSGSRDSVLACLQSALAAARWKLVPISAGDVSIGSAVAGLPSDSIPTASSTAPAAVAFSSRTAGIGGVMLRQKEKHVADEKLATEAFTDLSSLMSKAEEVVKLTERYVVEKTTDAGTDSLDESKFQSLVMDIGIANPITRKGAGRLYHSELAREIVNFIGPRLVKSGGIMTLTDVYCIYNRARGVDLISPDDILEAATLASSLSLPVRLKELKSGVMVLQSLDLDDEEVANRLVRLVTSRTSLTASDVATHWSLPLQIATEQLCMAEGKGYLCRDDTVVGIRFFPNKFPLWVV